MTERLRRIRSSLASCRDSGIPVRPSELQEIDKLLTAFPIERAELNASPKQLLFQQSFFDRRDPVTGQSKDIFVAMGGNRSGKSIVAGWMCFAKYLRDVAVDGDLFWCIGQTDSRSIVGQQKELWNALPRWMFGSEGVARATHGWRSDPQTWDEKIGFGGHRKIVLPTHDGGRCLVEFRSADQAPSTFEQAKCRGIWCDERLPETIYDRLLPRIIDLNGFILYSDIPEQFWQMSRLKGAKPDAGVYFQHFTMHDNAMNLPDGAIAKTMVRMTEDQQRQRIGGDFVVLDGIVYRQYVDRLNKDGGHLVKPFRIPRHWPKWRVIDYGASAPTACAWMTLGDDETAYCYREYYQKGLSVERNAAAILAMSGDEEYVETLMDPHAIDLPPVTYGVAKTVSQQYADAGISSTGWPYVNVMGEHAMVARVMHRLENWMFYLFEDCSNGRREMLSWTYKCDKEGKPVAKDAYSNENNHLLDTFKGFFGTNPTFTQPKFRVAG